MWYIVALGNPGDEYEATRHNVGWLMADSLIDRFHFPQPRADAHVLGRVTSGTIAGESVQLLFPDTYMNHVGNAVRRFVPEGEQSRLVVVHDEIALPFGTFKISVGRGAGGHNGVRSIIASVGTKDFIRIRVGIAPVSWLSGRMQMVPGAKLPEYVLGRLTKREATAVAEISPTLDEAVRSIIAQGPAVAMNRFNT